MKVTERELPRNVTELESSEDGNAFANHFYRALHIDYPQKEAYRSDPDVFSEQIVQEFPESFFIEENEVTAAQKITKTLITSWPEEVPLELFREGPQCIKMFCIQTIPILQRAYPHLDPNRIGHHLITSTIIAHAKLREAYGITPIPNTERIRMHLDISKALEDTQRSIVSVSKSDKEETPIFVRS